MNDTRQWDRPVLVTGATGCIGSAVCSLLHDRGIPVIGVDRAAPTNTFHRDFLQLDIRDTAALEPHVLGAGGLIHLAGWVHRQPRTPAEEADVYEVNQHATERLTVLAARAGAPVVLSSTVAVHGEEQPAAINEDTPVDPATPYARSKLAAERAVLSANGVVVRLPMAYGALDRGNMLTLIHGIARGRFVVPGKGASRRTFIGRWNAAEALLAALQSTAARGRLYLAADAETETLRNLTDFIAKELGRSPPRSMPVPVLSFAAAVGSVIEKTVGVRAPLSASSLAKLTRDATIAPDRARAELGYTPSKTLWQGLREEIAWYREQRT